MHIIPHEHIRNNLVVSAAISPLLLQAAEITAKAQGVKLSSLIREALSAKVLEDAQTYGDPPEAAHR
jgi:hypothetical protein